MTDIKKCLLLLFLIYKFFDGKSTGSGANMHANNERLLDQMKNYTNQLLETLKKNSLFKI